MKMIFKDGTGIGLREDVENSRFLADRALADREVTVSSSEVKELFLSYGYNLNAVNGSFLKIFTVNAKELKNITDVLGEIKELGLQEVFNANLDFVVFTRGFLDRVKYCVNNGLPFLNADNTFASFLRYKTTFESYVANLASSVDMSNSVATNQVVENSISQEVMVTPMELIQEQTQEQVNPQELVLDTEDLMVREELLRTLIKLREECNDGTLKFIITSIIANLDSVIALDKKAYKTVGTRHLIYNALSGVAITPDMQEDINSILMMFPEISNERGLAA